MNRNPSKILSQTLNQTMVANVFGCFERFFGGFSLLFSCEFISIKNALIQSIFWLEKCSLHENGVEFHQKLIGNVFRGITAYKADIPKALPYFSTEQDKLMKNCNNGLS